MKTIHLHDIVALMEETPAQRFPFGGQILLRRGQVGTVVEELGDGEAFEIEFSRSDGRAYAMVAVKAEQLLPLYYELRACGTGRCKLIETVLNNGGLRDETC